MSRAQHEHLQELTDAEKLATPVNWQHGQAAIIVPSLSNEEARKRFPQGWEEQKPYPRIVQPAR